MGQSLSTRIATRIALIEKWVNGKVPPDLDKIPASLNGWRQFHNPALGILRIGSKTGFTTTDPDYGGQIVILQGLINALNEKRGLAAEAAAKTKKRLYKPEATRRRLAEHERDAALLDLSKATGHWHQARHELELKTRQAAELTTTTLKLHAKIRERDDRIQFLLGRLRDVGLREV